MSSRLAQSRWVVPRRSATQGGVGIVESVMVGSSVVVGCCVYSGTGLLTRVGSGHVNGVTVVKDGGVVSRQCGSTVYRLLDK